MFFCFLLFILQKKPAKEQAVNDKCKKTAHGFNDKTARETVESLDMMVEEDGRAWIGGRSLSESSGDFYQGGLGSLICSAGEAAIGLPLKRHATSSASMDTYNLSAFRNREPGDQPKITCINWSTCQIRQVGQFMQVAMVAY